MDEGMRELAASLVALRRDLHAHPELAFEERRTAELVARELEADGIEVHRGLAATGVVGRLACGSGKRAIGLRADMDALPLTERNGFAHRSQEAGRMHACGHDGHVVMLLGAARWLARTRGFDGTVCFIFQPAEEGRGGARRMIEEGLFERFPMQSVYGLHNWPGLALGRIAVASGPVMASADEFDLHIAGRGAHAAMPHQGSDVIAAGAAMVQALHTVVSRNVDPLDSAVLSVTRFQAGDAYNVLPEAARISGTARAFRAEVRDALEAALGRVAAGVAAAFGVSAALEYRRGYPPTVNDPVQSAICREVAAALVGGENVDAGLPPSMGAEDFSFLAAQRPACYAWLGNGPGEGGCLLHSPHYDFNDEAIALGIAYWVALARKLLG
ncbi:MAG: M20 aminoacylase family protein [Rhodocyclaceae bacterium]